MKERDEILAQLNEEQLAAVTHSGSDSLILAGAGSGKTRVLTTKIAYLLTQGVPPFQILALTFTNKAAREMQDRIATLVEGRLGHYLTMGTFHSVFAKWLRQYTELLGYQQNYTIYDSTDSRSLIKIIVREMGLDDKVYNPNTLQALISKSKNDGILPKDMLSDSKLLANLSYRKIPEAATIYLEYQRRCKRANAMDFDDLLLNTYHLLKKAPEVRRNYQERYKYIFVDEYQDTNRIQHEIIKLLKNPEGEVTVVGDDAQSIYSFRGAVIENILRFPDSFPGAHLFKLTKNYRSTSNIVELANGLIAKNRKRIPKEIVAVADKGKKVLLMNAFTAQMEAQQVAAMISKLVKDGENPDEIAVLYRNNAQSRLLEDFLRMFKVEIRIVGGLSFYDRKEVKDLLAYLRLILNPNDDEAFRRIYNFPTRGIGATTFEKLAQLAKESEQPLMTVASSPQLLQAIKGAGAKKVQDFVALIAEMAGKQHDMEPDAYLKYVIRASGIAQQYSDGTVDSESRMENINELVNALADHMNRQKEMDDESPTLEGFIREMALYTDQDKNEDNSKPKVTLMTMHSSKGLEYNHVFCTGLESGIIPSQRSYSEAEVEEERRLLYVAITRAKKECVLSFARERMLYGKTNTAEPSIFLYDLNPEYVQDTSGILTKKPDVLPPHGTSAPSYTAEPKKVTTRIVRRKEKVKEEPLTTSEIGNYKVGDIVFHDKFGCGTIQSIDNSITGEKLTIRFEKEGVKQLLTKFAKLRKSN